MPRITARAVAAVCATFLVASSGCGGDDADDAADPGSKGGDISYEELAAQAPPSKGPRGDEKVVHDLEITAEEQERLDELAAEGPMKVAFSTQTLPVPYGRQVTASFKETILEHLPGTTVLLGDGEFKPEKQQADIEGFLAQDADAIVVAAIDQAAIVPPLLRINEAHVPLIVNATAPSDKSVKYDGFCGTDDFKGGWLAGAYLASNLKGEGEVASVDFPFDVFDTNNRSRGFKAAAKAGGLELAATGQAAANDDGDTVFQNILTANPNLKGGFGNYDAVALGMAQAAMSLGRDDVAVVTHDLTTPTSRQIRDGGIVKATSATLTDTMGKLCAMVVLKTLAGTDMRDFAAMSPAELVTAENVAEVHERLYDQGIDESKD